MKQIISIQLKAIILLTVFAMNTVVSLACTIGLDMNFNKKHHNEEQIIKAPIHTHADGKKHEHPSENVKRNHEEKKSAEKGGCCNKEVIKFQNVEKKINPKTTIDDPIFVVIASTYPVINLSIVNKAYHYKKIVRFFYPPPTDILIEIQRFQI